MSNYEYDLTQSFRATRDLIREDRDQFESLGEFQGRAAKLGIPKLRMHAGMIGVDVAPAHELLRLSRLHPAITKDAVEIAVGALQRSHEDGLDRRMEVDLKSEVGIYDEGGIDLALGIPLGRMGTESVNIEREAYSRCISAIVGRTIELQEYEFVEEQDDDNPLPEPYLLIGRTRIGKDDELDALAEEIEDHFWPEYVPGEAYVGPKIDETVRLYTPELHYSKVLTLPQ